MNSCFKPLSGFGNAFESRFTFYTKFYRLTEPQVVSTSKNVISGEVTSHPYDKLVLAPGAGAIVPNIPGIQAKNIFSVKTVPDSDAIKTFLTQNLSHQALVIGAGFIGLETAEALKNRGLKVTIVEKTPQILPPFDPDMARLVAYHLQEKGVEVIVGDGIKSFHQTGELAQEAELENGTRLPMDLAILSIGGPSGTKACTRGRSENQCLRRNFRQ